MLIAVATVLCVAVVLGLTYSVIARAIPKG
ncbi:MAG: hypothetical protein QOK04_2411 [Solirubrobacteraceae bacterium]|jgi:hypothetical protein|nr:hypothetical protein [Solirubrobacteraceae bacterium]